MAAAVSFVCPKCKAQLKGPAAMQGKRAKCKRCEHVFVMQAGAAEPRAAAAPATPSAPPVLPSAATAPETTTYSFLDDDKAVSAAAAQAAETAAKTGPTQFADNNPYEVTELDLTPRCPFCAQEMGEEDIICLHCGYNTQSRSLPTVERTYANTTTDILLWLAPGIGCLLIVLACLGGIAYMWLKIQAKDFEKEWYNINALRIWATIVLLIVGFFAARFLVKRLILHPTPPEKQKK